MFSKLTNVVAFAAFALPVVRAASDFLGGYKNMHGMGGGPMLKDINKQQSATEAGEVDRRITPENPNAGYKQFGLGARNEEDLELDARNEALRKKAVDTWWLRTNAPQEKFGWWPFYGKEYNTRFDRAFDHGNGQNNKRARDPFWRTAELVLGLSLGLGAFCATEYGFKNLALKNDTVTEALGMKGGEHDLHDVMFQNVKHLDGVDSNTVNFDLLQGYVYAYIMTGAFFVFLSLYCILHTSGLKKGYALGFSSLILVAGAISAAGFCAHMHTAVESDMWYHNTSIWVGVGLATAVVALSIGFSIYACVRSRQLAPKPDDMNGAQEL